MSGLAENPTTPFVEAMVSELKTFKTQFDVFRFMKRLTEYYDSRFFMVFNLPPATSLEFSSSSIITNWPADLLSGYDETKLLSDSPVIRHLRGSAIPLSFDFEAASLASSRPLDVPKELFARFRLVRGAYYPVHDPVGTRGAVSFAGDRSPFSLQEHMELLFLAVHIFNQLAAIRDLDHRATDNLTEREIDCLNWTAAGKTSVEIAEILGLSEHTINHYLNRATKKLDTVNRTQAVAKALRIGLIK